MTHLRTVAAGPARPARSVLLVCLISGCTQVGRYQIMESKGEVFRLDTATGRVKDLGSNPNDVEGNSHALD